MSTWVCCSMTSLTHTRYGSLADGRQGRSRAWRSYQAEQPATHASVSKSASSGRCVSRGRSAHSELGDSRERQRSPAPKQRASASPVVAGDPLDAAVVDHHADHPHFVSAGVAQVALRGSSRSAIRTGTTSAPFWYLELRVLDDTIACAGELMGLAGEEHAAVRLGRSTIDPRARDLARFHTWLAACGTSRCEHVDCFRVSVDRSSSGCSLSRDRAA